MNNKKINRILLVAAFAIILSAVLLLVGCGVQVNQIYIKNDEKPQLVFVQGEELDLSGGKLTVETEKETLSLDLTSPEVSVTGYDKDTLGQQTLTVTYGEKTTTLKVTVVRRMVFEGCTVNYFVNENFDKAKGNVKITRDDGTTFSAQMSSDAFTIENFDSSSAKNSLMLNVRYSANGETYTDTLPVNVYNIGKVQLTKPNKIQYKSHETEFDTAGGFFTITAEGNSSFYKYVELDYDSMVSGFDVSVATPESRFEPISQIVKITYAGTTVDFPITISYSGVSLMQDAAKDIMNIDWKTELPEGEEYYTEAQGLAAYEAISAYFEMGVNYQNLVPTEIKEAVARVAALYVSEKYIESAEIFSEAFTITNSGYRIIGTSYEGMVEVCERFNLQTGDFFVYGDLLDKITNEFGEVVYYVDKVENNGIEEDVEVTIDYVSFVIPAEDLEILVGLFEHMVKLYEDLAPIKAGWTAESLEAYGTNVAAAVRHISNETFSSYVNYNFICSIVSGWREADDYFDIIYTYYYNYKRDAMEEDLFWGKVSLPGELQDLYIFIASASYESTVMHDNNPLWYDTTAFLYYYKEAIDLASKIKKSDNEFYKELYEFFDFDNIITDYITRSGAGYVNLSGALYGDKEFLEILNMYLDIVEPFFENEEYDLEAAKDDIAALLDAFIKLSPTKQQVFLSSLFFRYRSEEVMDTMLFAYPDLKVKGYFIYFIVLYLGEYMPDCDEIVQDTLLAVEYYLNKDKYDDALENFFKKMDEIKAAYNELSPANQALYDEYLGAFMTKYTAIYDYEKNPESVELDAEYSEILGELESTLRDFYIIKNFLTNEENGAARDTVYILLFAIFDKAETLAYKILTSQNEAAILAYYSMDITVGDSLINNADIILLDARITYISILVNATLTTTEGEGEDAIKDVHYAWDLYYPSGIQSFTAMAEYIMIKAYKDEGGYDKDTVLAIMKLMTEIEARPINLFYAFDGEVLYYKGLRAFFAEVLSETNLAVSEKLIAAEMAYAAYIIDNDNAELRDAFVAAVSELTEAVAEVSDTANYEQYLKTFCEFYISAANNIPEAEA